MLNVSITLSQGEESNVFFFFFFFYSDPPIVSVNNDLIQSEQYQNVTLVCHALSRPFSQITWEKNGKIIEENKMTNTRVNQTMSTSRLTVQVCVDIERFYS